MTGAERLRAVVGVLACIFIPLAGAQVRPAPALTVAGAPFMAGAASVNFTPPIHGKLSSDLADCLSAANALVYTGVRQFAFEEPYIDLMKSGHYDFGDPFLDCNLNGRWDGDFTGGGSGTPRYYNKVLDEVGARVLVVSAGGHSIAVEVVDQEGLFNVYADRIRQKVAADGYALDQIFISATHDESAPDSLGLGGPNQLSSGVNDYFVSYLVAQSAAAIEQAYHAQQSAHLRYAEAREPDNLRQCWSSYPFVDNRLMPTLQAVADADGSVIATLTSVSQHTETLGFNNDPVEGLELTSDWPHFFRAALESRYGGVAIEMAGSVGSVESPQVFSAPLAQTPAKFVSASHPAGCRTLLVPPAGATETPLGYQKETRAYGELLAQTVGDTLDASAEWSATNTLWGERSQVCLPVSNLLFRAAGLAGVFAQRPIYLLNCTIPIPALPNGTTAGVDLLSEVGAFRIGDGGFIALPGEVFPFTYLRGFLGPDDMPVSTDPLPPWPIPHLHTPYRFFDGLAGDMVGYIFPTGNGVGVPGESLNNPLGQNDTDRFGCGHSDDSESATSQAADLLGPPLIAILDAQDGKPPAEAIEQGRYVLPDGTVSRDPLGGPEIKCNVDQTFTAKGPAVAVWTAAAGAFYPAGWISLSGRLQATPDRDTRGYLAGDGSRHWLEVFPDIAGAPATVTLPGGSTTGGTTAGGTTTGGTTTGGTTTGGTTTGGATTGGTTTGGTTTGGTTTGGTTTGGTGGTTTGATSGGSSSGGAFALELLGLAGLAGWRRRSRHRSRR